MEINISEIADKIHGNDRERLCRFTSDARVLRSCTLVVKKYQISAKVCFKIDSGLSFPVDPLPPHSEIVEFVTNFRYFYLQKELSHFPRVLNVIGGALSQPEAVMSIRELRKRWKNYLIKKAIRFDINGQSITSDYILDLWINGRIHHRDQAKADELTKLEATISPELSKYLLLDACYEGTYMVCAVDAALSTLGFGD